MLINECKPAFQFKKSSKNAKFGQCLHLVANRGPTDCNPTLTSEKIIKRSKSDNLVILCKYSGFNGRVKNKQSIFIQNEIIVNDSL